LIGGAAAAGVRLLSSKALGQLTAAIPRIVVTIESRGNGMKNQGKSSREGTVTVRGAASGFAQTIETRSHRFTADEPVTVGGTDTGPTPYDLLLAALGS
jgi:hypothetical protein